MTLHHSPIVDADLLAIVQSLYDRGSCLDAWDHGRQLGHLREWPAGSARLLAGRLAVHLGAPRLGALLHALELRSRPHDPDAQYYHLYRVMSSRGHLAAWQERQRFGAPAATAAPETLADYHGQCAQILGGLRDFERAESHLSRSRGACEARPYWFVERASLFEQQDRYDDALAAARDGLSLEPRYPPLIVSVARALQLLGRTDEALHVLRMGAQDSQSSYVHAALARLLLRFRLLDEVPAALARYEELTPLRERELDNWLASTRADVAVHRGDYDGAMHWAARIDHPYYLRVRDHLRAFLEAPLRRPPRRVELPVPFVRQHHLTCSPATLASISLFWQQPAEHLSIVEEICYDGTPDHSERQWADDHGWRTVEFRVDWDNARALIDRGVPFTLTVRGVASAHLQAVIGYDDPTGALLVRDPSVEETVEMNAQGLFEQQRSSGPRGMALVPADRAHLLDGLSLPDAALHDLHHAVQRALHGHDRGRAVALYEAMVASDPTHRLTLSARRSLAAYDDNPGEALAAIDALLALHPDDQHLRLARIASLRALTTREERLSWLSAECDKATADPYLAIEYATELMADGRRLSEAGWLMKRALRQRVDDPWGIHQLATLRWIEDRKEEAVELFRFAACLDPLRETMAASYFTACRSSGEADAGLAFLRRRWESLGHRSSGPAMSLFDALELLERIDEALALLDEAIAQREDDGELLLFASARLARYGRTDAARTMADSARGRVKHVTWLADAARQARVAGHRPEALRHWREILSSEPLNLEAHNAIALLLSEMGSAHEARTHLHEYCGRFPHHAGLHALLHHWSASEPAIERERVLRALIAINPTDAWARGELAVNLVAQARLEDALHAAEEGLALAPGLPSTHAVLAHVLRANGREPEAAGSFRAAIERAVDAGGAVPGLLEVCGDDMVQRKEALAFVVAELERQPVPGDGVLAFREAARGVLTPEELLDLLMRLHQRRPDLSQVHSALASHLMEMGRTDEALTIAREATARFPRTTRAWRDLAMVHRARLELTEELRALDRCRELGPEWIEPIVWTADALERSGRFDEVLRLLENAVARLPLAPALRMRLAEILHRRGERDRAIATLRTTLEISPGHEPAWHALLFWDEPGGDGASALEIARSFAEARAREPLAWLRLAELELQAGQPERALQATEHVLSLDPTHPGAHDLRATALVGLRRFREARDACTPPVLEGRMPVLLAGRAAWVAMQRGDGANAIAQMRQLVMRQPDYLWGWAQLVEWHAARKELAEAAEAAARWAWLDPSNVVPLGWLGDLRRRMHDVAGAKEVFQRAMRLQPSYLFAGKSLFHLQREGEDLEAATRTLEILQSHAPSGDVAVMRAELAVAGDDIDAAIAELRALCRDPEADDESLASLVRAIAGPSRRTRVESALRDALDEPVWHRLVPLLWSRVRNERRVIGHPWHIRRLATLGEPGVLAASEILDGIGRRLRTAEGHSLATRALLAWHVVVVRFCFRGARSNPLFWGNVGYALVCIGAVATARRWMRDWRTRDGVEPWMLQNLAVALLLTDRDREALEVLRHVGEEVIPRAEVGSTLGLWSLVAACLERDFDRAANILHVAPEDAVPVADRPLLALATLLPTLLADANRGAPLTSEESRVLAAAAASGRDGASKRLTDLALLAVARHRRQWRELPTAWLRVHRYTAYTIYAILGLMLLRLLTIL